MGGRKPAEQPSGNKTPQVMKLVQHEEDGLNPVVVAGKSRIPRQLRRIEPLSRMMRRESAQVYGIDPPDGEGRVTINLTALIIEDNAVELLRRFNACDCPVCIEQLSRLAAQRLPSRFTKAAKSVLIGGPRLEELKAPHRRQVITAMMRIVIANRKRSFHD